MGKALYNVAITLAGNGAPEVGDLAPALSGELLRLTLASEDGVCRLAIPVRVTAWAETSVHPAKREWGDSLPRGHLLELPDIHIGLPGQESSLFGLEEPDDMIDLTCDGCGTVMARVGHMPPPGRIEIACQACGRGHEFGEGVRVEVDYP